MNAYVIGIFLIIFVCGFVLTWLVFRGSEKLMGRYQDTFTSSAQVNLQEMFLFIDAKRLFQGNLLMIVLVPIIVFVFLDSLLFAIVSGIGVAILPKFAYSWLKKRRIKKFDEQLPDTLMTLAGGMRSGASLPLAIEALVKEASPPTSQELSMVLREQRLGVPLDDAFENLAARVPSPELALVVSAVRIAREVGGNLAETFDRLSDTIRKKAAMEGKIKALTSQGVLQGIVVGLLPVALIIVLFQLEPQAMYPLLHSLLGWALCGVMSVMGLLAFIMIRKIVSIDV